METRTLGRTGYEATVLGYGSMGLRDEPAGQRLDEAHAGRLLNSVLDQGINLIDTSPDYGVAEERIGRHLSHRRDEYFLASKCGCLAGWTATNARDRSPHDFGRDNIVAALEQSLRRLDTDHLDLLQVHSSETRSAPLEEDRVVETMVELRDQGKVRFLGMSSTLPDLSEHIALGVFDVFQIPYSVLQPEHHGAIHDAAAAGAGVLVRGGAAKGAPSGTVAQSTRFSHLTEVWEQADLDDLHEGMSPMEFTLRFTISHPGMTSTIVGTTNPTHLQDNLAAAAHGPLPPDVYEEALRRLGIST